MSGFRDIIKPGVGLITQAWAGQREGKTAVLVAMLLWLMGYGGYSPSECCGNQSVYIKGYQKFTNAELMVVLRRMITEHVRHKVILIAEADRAFPPRFWHDEEQTRALLGLWQNEKMENWILYDTHYGGVDILLERATQLYLVPHYVPELDCIDVEVISKVDLIPATTYGIDNVSEIVFPYYDTKEPVD